MFIQKKDMKIVGLDQTRGTLETLLVLLKEGSKRPTDLIRSISVSADTFYVIVKILKKYNLVIKQYDESLDALVWSLTDKGREIAKFLDEIEKKLNQ